MECPKCQKETVRLVKERCPACYNNALYHEKYKNDPEHMSRKRSQQKEYYKENLSSERLRNLEKARKKAKTEIGREKLLNAVRKYEAKPENKEKRKLYRQNNKGIINAKTAKRRAQKLRATLPGFEKELREIYSNCPPGYQVDHIIPLQGKDISGLHVPWNLQYLPAVENKRKSNKWQN